MHKRIILLSVFFYSISAFSQKGTGTLQAAMEMVTPVGPAALNIGYGGYIKWLHALSDAGEITLTAGMATSRMVQGGRRIFGIRTIPVQIGYRLTKGRFYLEPQLGFGEIGGRFFFQGGHSKPSYAAFTWGGGTGYRHGDIDIGVRYVMVDRLRNPKWPGANGQTETARFQYIGICIAYDLADLIGK